MTSFKQFLPYLRATRQKPRFRQKIWLVSLHALWLVIFVILLQYIPFTQPAEKDFLKWAAIWRHNILSIDHKPLLDSVVFIDVSHDLDLIPDGRVSYDSAPPFKGPEQVITDRHKLAYFFSILNEHPRDYRYVLCDILFEDPSLYDEALGAEMKKIPRLITTAYLSDETPQRLVRPVFTIPNGIVNYTALQGSLFYKLPIYYNDSLKSLPALMYEQASKHHFSRWWRVTCLDGQPTFNSVLPEFYFRPADLVYGGNGRKVNTYYLGELLLAGSDAFEMLRGKYIVIGNFLEDTHSTYLGKMPGPLILWDSYLTLTYGRITLPAGWLLLLYAISWMASFKIFFHTGSKPEKMKQRIKKIWLPALRKFLLKYLSYLGVCALIDLLSLLFFGTFISIFYLATYLTFAEWLIEEYPEWWPKLRHLSLHPKLQKA